MNNHITPVDLASKYFMSFSESQLQEIIDLARFIKETKEILQKEKSCQQLLTTATQH